MCGAVSAALVVQWLSIRKSWFFLDDVRNLAEARRFGLGWHLLSTPIGEHLAPGHRVLDWIVAVPFDRRWSVALALLLICSGVWLGYLAAALTALWGRSAWLAIPVVLAGTAWPALATAQWFAGAAHFYPIAACLTAAIYHHVRAVTEPRHRRAVYAWSVVAFTFAIQPVLLPVLLVTAGLVARGRLSRSTIASEARNVAPVIAIVAAAAVLNVLTVESKSKIPSLGDTLSLMRAMVTRSWLPSLSGIGVAGEGASTHREVVSRLVALCVIVVLIVAAWLCGRRWRAGLLFMAVGVVATGSVTAIGRLSVIGPGVAGSEPRYQLPMITMTALGMGALLGGGRKATRDRRWTLPLMGFVAVATALYGANLTYSYRARTVFRDFGGAAHERTRAVEQALSELTQRGELDALEDGPLPFPLWYFSEPRPDTLREWGQFFVREGVDAPGIPDGGKVFSISPETGELVEGSVGDGS